MSEKRYRLKRDLPGVKAGERCVKPSGLLVFGVQVADFVAAWVPHINLPERLSRPVPLFGKPALAFALTLSAQPGMNLTTRNHTAGAFDQVELAIVPAPPMARAKQRILE